jgi:riboflavin synthase
VFTGIVEEVGTVVSATRLADDHLRLAVRCTTVVEDAGLGDSISVGGCCLTVTSLLEGRGGFTADLMDETLRATALGALQPGDEVNLERAMQLGDRLGGHLVQGHVDAVGEIVDVTVQPGTTFVRMTAPPEVARYLVPKGSITIDGTSLTVVDVDDDARPTTFRVGLIPHTLSVTTWGDRGVGARVNLEADAMAKYADRLLAGGADSVYSAPLDDDTPPGPVPAGPAPGDRAPSTTHGDQPAPEEHP